MISTAKKYWHTLRYLRPVQFYGRVWFKIRRPRPNLAAAPGVRSRGGEWTRSAERMPSMFGADAFVFLNQSGELVGPGDWDNPAVEKLWRYNLHYFDDLNAKQASERVAWHHDLLARWVAENPPGLGVGWEPYPISLRIVNWIKWALAGNELDETARHSLAVQTRYLTGRLEYHLLGNHLFANAKALVFAGAFFVGDEAEGWLRRGMAILQREIPEQILPDGGQFERSPMYHALAFEDMLDLVNLARCFPEAFTPWRQEHSAWPDLLKRMARWLAAMCHPDGEIAFFNDAAIGIAPAPEELFTYAQRLGLARPELNEGITWLKDSGYIRVQHNGAVLLLDVAPVGPDYLPGHAHADSLSFELSLAGRRVVVNSGTSCYGTGKQRQYERSTAAHSTLEVDGENSSEVWAGFRVARRARVFAVEVREDAGAVLVEAAHDGYSRLPGKAVHRRSWRLADNRLEITDRVEGSFREALVRVFWHPDWRAGGQGIMQCEGGIMTDSDCFPVPVVCWQADGVLDALLEPAEWYPRFGHGVASNCLAMRLDGKAGAAGCRFKMEWG